MKKLLMLLLSALTMISCSTLTADEYKNRGKEKLQLEDFIGAIADYNKAIEIDPQDANAYYNRGVAKICLGDYSGAITDCNTTIEIDPKFGDAYLTRGSAKIQLGQKDSGCLDYSKSCKLNDGLGCELSKGKMCN